MRLRWWMIAVVAALFLWQQASAQTVSSPQAFVFIPLAANDFNFSQAGYEGYQKLSREGYRIGYRDHADKLSPSEILDTIDRKYADGVTAFIMAGAEFSDVTMEAARIYPRAYFATLGGNARGGNIINYCLDCLSLSGEIAGKVALELSSSRIIGYVGGVAAVDGPEAEKFKAVVLAGDPKAQVLIGWTENWADLAGAAKLTEQQIGKGADMVYATANTGVISAADKHPAVKIIGALVDVSPLSKNVVASVVLNTDVIYRHFLQSVEFGKFKGGGHTLTTGDGVWSVVRPK